MNPLTRMPSLAATSPWWARGVLTAALCCAAVTAQAGACSAMDANECEITLPRSGTVTLTLQADHGAFDHGLYLLNGTDRTLVFASSNGTDAAAAGTDGGTASFGAAITPLGATFVIADYVAGTELIFGLYGYDSSRWGGGSALLTTSYTGSLSGHNTGLWARPGEHTSYVEGGGSDHLTVHLSDLFGQSADFNGSDGNIKFTAQVSAVPEPGGWALMLAGLGALFVRGARRAHGCK